MMLSRDYLNQLAAEAKRLDAEAKDLQLRGRFVLAADKRAAADSIREQIQALQNADGVRRLAVRFG